MTNIQNKTKILDAKQKEVLEKITTGEKEIDDLEKQIRSLHRQAKDQQSIMKAFSKPNNNDLNTASYGNGNTFNFNNTGTTMGGTATSGLTENEMETMKFAILRSQMIEKSKKQTEEIEFLEKELEKMRLKTFPTFSNNTLKTFKKR